MPGDPSLELLDRLSSAESEADLHDAYRGALAAYDELNARTIQETGARLACCAGCSFCCSLRVDVYAHEAFLLAHHIRTTFSKDEYEALLVRLAERSTKVLPLTPFEHATQNIPCALLRDGRCSVYAVRPMACRRHHSLDVSVCQYTFDNPADLQFPAAHEEKLFETLTVAMKQAASVYAECHLDTTIYELGTALEEALLDEESWRSWLQHLEAFAKASISPSE